MRTVYSFRFLNGFVVYNRVCIYCFVVLVFTCASRKADLQHYNDAKVRATDGTQKKERECESSDGKGNRK